MDKLCLEINRLLWSAWQISYYFWHFCGTVNSKMIHSADIYWFTCCVQDATRNLFHGNGLCSCGMHLLVRKREIHKQADKKGSYKPCYKWNYKKLRKGWTREDCKARPLWRANIWAKTDRRESRSECTNVMWEQQQQNRMQTPTDVFQLYWAVSAEDWKVSGWPEAEPYHLRICSP